MKHKSVLLFLRVALAASYLSAVADRFGLWGAAGTPGVSWGNFENFIQYTGTLNFFMPKILIPVTAWVATILEVLIAILLLAGIRIKETGYASALLLAAFFITMTIANGIKGPLDYSVFTACAASLVLAAYYSKKAA